MSNYTQTKYKDWQLHASAGAGTFLTRRAGIYIAQIVAEEGVWHWRIMMSGNSTNLTEGQTEHLGQAVALANTALYRIEQQIHT